MESSETDISHHRIVDFQLAVKSEAKALKLVTCRNLKNIEMESFMKKVEEKIHITETCFGDNMRKYNTVLRELVDMEAPLQNRSIKVVSSAPWFDGEYKELRKQRRKAEKKSKKTNTPVDKEKYIQLRKQTTQLAYEKKCKHYGDKLVGNNHLMYSSINQLLDNEQEAVFTSRSFFP